MLASSSTPGSVRAGLDRFAVAGVTDLTVHPRGEGPRAPGQALGLSR
ncbi:hypothetical protein [Sciscionella marina]|nr:hypothetical protein [Sciscionella marina]